MKKMILPLLMMLFATLMISVIPTEAEAAIYSDTVRLHILANSDSERDQALKLEIRDAVLEKFGTQLKGSEDKTQAEEKIFGMLAEIEEFAEGEVKARGFDYSVTAALGEEWYDTRNYGDISLPAGRYTSLRIIIGEGEGKNWWCVMFPPMCLDIATEEAPADDALLDYSKEEISLIKDKKYNVKFKVLELLSDVFD